MTRNNRLLIVSGSRRQTLYIREQIYDVVGNNCIEIFAYIYTEEERQPLDQILSEEPQLVICTGTISYEMVKKYKPRSKIIRVDLDLREPESLDLMFLIPPGKDVLVCNMTEESTHQVVVLFERLGINHIRYIPYWGGCTTDVSHVDTAVSTGMMQYCPEHIQNRIDIGLRTLSIHSFVDILLAFDLDLSYADTFAETQKRVLTSTYKKLSQEYVDTQKLRLFLQSVLDHLNEAIFTVDYQYRIIEMNATAVEILGKKKELIIGQSLLDGLPALQGIIDGDDDKGIIVTIQSQRMYATCFQLAKPPEPIWLIRLQGTQTIQKSDEEVRRLLYQKEQGLVARYTFADIQQHDESMKRIVDNAKKMALSDYTILICGESGTGKELFAQSIHNYSSRSDKPFVGVNFAALPENLIESELFGYEDGAFTGARKSGKKGLFELAHTGTIFLDEIGDASMSVQTRLLRVLEEKQIMRIGSSRIVPIDVRVIAATNKDLKQLILSGSFREDLYYRINAFHLTIPPLRERPGNILPLMYEFLQRKGKSLDFTPEATEAILNYRWKGNVRELRNMVDYLAFMVEGGKVSEANLPLDMDFDHLMVAADSELSNILHQLLVQYPFDLLEKTLEIVARNSLGKAVGVSRMIEILRNTGIAVSQSALRSLLKLLSCHKLVEIGKTKQGTVLTPRGEELLQIIKNGAP